MLRACHLSNPRKNLCWQRGTLVLRQILTNPLQQGKGFMLKITIHSFVQKPNQRIVRLQLTPTRCEDFRLQQNTSMMQA